jgi:hypothetical protein
MGCHFPLRITWLFLYPSLLNALIIHYPLSLASHILTPLYNFHIGPQQQSSNITAPCAYVNFKDACSETSHFTGKVVLLDNTSPASKDQKEEHTAALCLEHRGALAIVRVIDDIGSPGFASPPFPFFTSLPFLAFYSPFAQFHSSKTPPRKEFVHECLPKC